MSPLLTQYLVIGLGGALGSMLRFGIAGAIDLKMIKAGGLIFPLGTIIVNITGCFIIGFMATISATEGRVLLSPLTRNFIMIGMLGGYTTFSSFSLQTLALAQGGQWWAAAANVLISVVLCLVGVWLGAMLAGSPGSNRRSSRPCNGTARRCARAARRAPG